MPIRRSSDSRMSPGDAAPAAFPFCTAIDQRSTLPERSLVNKTCLVCVQTGSRLPPDVLTISVSPNRRRREYRCARSLDPRRR